MIRSGDSARVMASRAAAEGRVLSDRCSLGVEPADHLVEDDDQRIPRMRSARAMHRRCPAECGTALADPRRVSLGLRYDELFVRRLCMTRRSCEPPRCHRARKEVCRGWCRETAPEIALRRGSGARVPNLPERSTAVRIHPPPAGGTFGHGVGVLGNRGCELYGVLYRANLDRRTHNIIRIRRRQ